MRGATSGGRGGVRVAVPSVTRWGSRLAAAAAIVLGVSALLQLPASAAGLYSTGASGFDISYPNCGATLPSLDSFALVGVGAGRPFTTNSCLTSEWNAAQKATGATPSLYFNTGYSGAYTRNIDTTTCPAALSSAKNAYPGLFSGLSRHDQSQAQQAWELGCSEAEYAYGARPAGSPLMWWADIETGNSWSSNSLLNDYTVDGISYQMESLGGGGVYSSPAMWASITGSMTFQPTPPATANWVTGASCTASFSRTTPTWLAQGVQVNGVDTDTAC